MKVRASYKKAVMIANANVPQAVLLARHRLEEQCVDCSQAAQQKFDSAWLSQVAGSREGHSRYDVKDLPDKISSVPEFPACQDCFLDSV